MKFSIALFLCLSNLIFCQAQTRDFTLAEVELKDGTIIRGGFKRLDFNVLNRPLQIDIVNIEKVFIKSADSDSTEEDFIETLHIINFSAINTVKILQNEVIQIPSIALKSKVKLWPQKSQSQAKPAIEEMQSQPKPPTEDNQICATNSLGRRVCIPKIAKEGIQSQSTPATEEMRSQPRPSTEETQSQVDKIERGPRGGCYYVSKTGKKTYVNKSRCN